MVVGVAVAFSVAVAAGVAVPGSAYPQAHSTIARKIAKYPGVFINWFLFKDIIIIPALPSPPLWKGIPLSAFCKSFRSLRIVVQSQNN